MTGPSAARRAAVAVVVVALATALGAPAAGAAADDHRIGIRLLDTPGAGSEDARAHRYMVDHLAPGARLTHRIEVSNDSAEPVAFDLYAGTPAPPAPSRGPTGAPATS